MVMSQISMVYPDTSESGETYDLQMFTEPIEVGSSLYKRVATWSQHQKGPLRCQEWNDAFLYDGHRFCTNGCGLWLCAHHQQKHETSCPNKKREPLLAETR